MEQFRPGRWQILPVVVKNLLIINGLTFFATLALPKLNINLYDLLGLHFFTSHLFMPHQIVTHMFMHGTFMHLFSNMFALWMFGSVLENVWGPKRFLLFYFACGLGGALAHTGVTWYNYERIQDELNVYYSNPGITQFATLMTNFDHLVNQEFINEFVRQWQSNPSSGAYLQKSFEYAGSVPGILADIPVVGASGAVFGVLIAFGMLFPNTYLYIYFLFPIKAKYFVMIYALFELYAGFNVQDNVAHFAHLGGAAVGFLLVKYWNRRLRGNFY